MPNENNNMPNTIKYSIWQTRTDEKQHINKEKITEVYDGSSLEEKNNKDAH